MPKFMYNPYRLKQWRSQEFFLGEEKYKFWVRKTLNTYVIHVKYEILGEDHPHFPQRSYATVKKHG